MILAVVKDCNSQTISRDGEIYKLSIGDLSFCVSSEAGGRIVSFSRGGCELLASDSIHPIYYGATFWLSPQSDYWPPYPTVDKLPYKATVSDNTLRMQSQTDKAGIRITKEFSVSPSDSAIYIKYRIDNISGQALRLAPWNVVRVFGGLSFFAMGENNEDINKSDIPGTYIKNGVVWFPFTQRNNEKGQKLFNTAKDGWMAHYYKQLLFVNCFPDIKIQEIPPKQGEVEIFVAPKGAYLELENHGRYSSLAPNESVEYNQKCFLISPGQGKTKEELLRIVEQLDKKVF